MSKKRDTLSEVSYTCYFSTLQFLQVKISQMPQEMMDTLLITIIIEPSGFLLSPSIHSRDFCVQSYRRYWSTSSPLCTHFQNVFLSPFGFRHHFPLISPHVSLLNNNRSFPPSQVPSCQIVQRQRGKFSKGAFASKIEMGLRVSLPSPRGLHQRHPSQLKSFDLQVTLWFPFTMLSING